jgi:hypothetical protein
LSEDEKMGRDSVVECLNESGSVKAYTSLTEVGNGKYDAPRTGIVSKTNVKECLELNWIYFNFSRRASYA